MAMIKAATGAMITLANDLAVRDGRNRSVSEEVIARLEPEIFYPVSLAMIHNDEEMRVEFFNPGESGLSELILIDMSFGHFAVLPEFNVEGGV
tara:strand:+ start:184 stop:462 length:279 start_codon:yes stop_codon:yes gene_type:complete